MTQMTIRGFDERRGVAATVRRADWVLPSAIGVGELLYGFRHGGRYEENAARLEAFLANAMVTLLEVGQARAAPGRQPLNDGT